MRKSSFGLKQEQIISEHDELELVASEEVTRFVAIDCEMDVDEDGRSQVIKFTAVNEACEVLLDTLVNPDVAIRDNLEEIHGIRRS